MIEKFDTKELDSLIEESRNFKINQRFRKSERAFKRSVLLLLFSPFVCLPFLLFSKYGIYISIVYCCFCFFPSFYECFKQFVEELLKDSYENVDMTKRYHHK